jgi:hypothetical protein
MELTRQECIDRLMEAELVARASDLDNVDLDQLRYFVLEYCTPVEA